MKVDPEKARQLPLEDEHDGDNIIQNPILMQYASVANLIKSGIVSPIPYETLQKMSVEEVLIWVQVSRLDVLNKREVI